jgi:hypothetical protein
VAIESRTSARESKVKFENEREEKWGQFATTKYNTISTRKREARPFHTQAATTRHCTERGVGVGVCGAETSSVRWQVKTQIQSSLRRICWPFWADF